MIISSSQNLILNLPTIFFTNFAYILLTSRDASCIGNIFFGFINLKINPEKTFINERKWIVSDLTCLKAFVVYLSMYIQSIIYNMTLRIACYGIANVLSDCQIHIALLLGGSLCINIASARRMMMGLFDFTPSHYSEPPFCIVPINVFSRVTAADAVFGCSKNLCVAWE